MLPINNQTVQDSPRVSIPTKVKITLFFMGSILALGGVALHFSGLNALAAYVVGGTGGATFIGTAIYSMIDHRRKNNEKTHESAVRIISEPAVEEDESRESLQQKLPSYFTPIIQKAPFLGDVNEDPRELNGTDSLYSVSLFKQGKHMCFSFTLCVQYSNTKNSSPITEEPFFVQAYLLRRFVGGKAQWCLELRGEQRQHRGNTFRPVSIIPSSFKTENFSEDPSEKEEPLNLFIFQLLTEKNPALPEYKSFIPKKDKNNDPIIGYWNISLAST